MDLDEVRLTPMNGWDKMVLIMGVLMNSLIDWWLQCLRQAEGNELDCLFITILADFLKAG